MGDIWFVTGTDTGVGKTVVTAALTAGLRAAGWRVRGVKPLETGCLERAGRLVGEDAAALAEAAGDGRLETGLYRYALPLAPSAAARLGGESPVDLARVVDWLRAQSAAVDTLLVEGVGGLMVPLTDAETVLDLIRRLEPAAVLLVARNRLGVLSQVLTAVRVLELEQLPLAGVVLNEGEGPAGLAEESNGVELERWVRPVVPFSRIDGLEPAALAAAGLVLARAVGLAR